MTLEERLNGFRFSGITIWHTAKGYQANVKREGSDGWTCVTAATPSEALAGALGAPVAPPKTEFKDMF